LGKKGYVVVVVVVFVNGKSFKITKYAKLYEVYKPSSGKGLSASNICQL